VDLRLREPVAVESVTLEHIHRQVAYDIASAPKTVVALGWNSTRTPPAAGGIGSGDGAVLLGKFRYDINGRGVHLSTFHSILSPPHH